MNELNDIHAFLAVPTPAQWVEQALDNQALMLIDHAHCEKKAASSALSLIYRYPDKGALLQKMSRLAREELRHFEQVLSILERRNIPFKNVSAGRYAQGLRDHVRADEPRKLVDSLIIGAFIEARSCERFACVAPHLDGDLRQFYSKLLSSEARHFKDYLSLAQQYAGEDIAERVRFFCEIEAQLIESPDDEFRFHSGPVSVPSSSATMTLDVSCQAPST